MSTDWISQQAVHSPDKIAIYFEDQEISYLSYYYHAVAFQNYIEINYPNIEKIGILMESCPEYLYLIMAGMRLQSIIVPLNTRLSTSELQNQIEFLDIKLIFTKNTFNSLISDLNLNIVNIDTIAQSLKFDGIVSINLDYSQIQFIVFTSGSTGKPKGVQISFYNNFYSSIASGLKLGVFSDDNWL
ncbi:MAG: AMP-binding protein, partial [Candidatus Heimdallarchaeota archaeon]|nr:AMP-binding protein [Candidatus Heimdallarchaeota archaeon]